MPDRRHELVDARRPGRPRRRARRASSAPCPTTATGSAPRSADAARRPTLVLISGGSSTGPGGPRPGPRGRAGRARRSTASPSGRPARPDWDSSRQAGPRSGRLLPGQPGELPLRLRLLRRADRPAAGRAAASTGPIARSSLPLAQQARPRSSGGSITRGCGSGEGGSSPWPSAVPRSSRARPGPTASSSSRPTSKAIPPGAASRSGFMTRRYATASPRR